MIKLFCNCILQEKDDKPKWVQDDKKIRIWRYYFNAIGLCGEYIEDSSYLPVLSRDYLLILTITEDMLKFIAKEYNDEIYGIDFYVNDENWIGEYSYRDGYFVPEHRKAWTNYKGRVEKENPGVPALILK